MPSKEVVIGATAAKLVDVNERRTDLVIANADNALILYVSDDSDVTADNGFPVFHNTWISINKADGDKPDQAWWAIASGAGCSVRVLEQLGDYPIKVFIVNVINPSPQEPYTPIDAPDMPKGEWQRGYGKLR
jgi:hypothetical protein